MQDFGLFFLQGPRSPSPSFFPCFRHSPWAGRAVAPCRSHRRAGRDPHQGVHRTVMPLTPGGRQDGSGPWPGISMTTRGALLDGPEVGEVRIAVSAMIRSLHERRGRSTMKGSRATRNASLGRAAGSSMCSRLKAIAPTQDAPGRQVPSRSRRRPQAAARLRRTSPRGRHAMIVSRDTRVAERTNRCGCSCRIGRSRAGRLGPFPERKNAAMKTPVSVPFSTTAILALAEIKAAVESFDRGDSNVFDALDAVIVAIEAHRAATASDSLQEHRQQDAA